jgi:uncharacterized protein
VTPRRWLLLAVIAAAVLLLAGRALARAYVDYQWYSSLGATEVWRAKAGATSVLLIVSWVTATLFVFANLYAVRHSVVSLVLPRRVANLEIGEEVPGTYLTIAVVSISVLLGAVLTVPQGDWSSFVAARSYTPFGETDPYLDVDLGFFVYWLPFEARLYTWTLISIFIVAALVLFLYALTPSLRWERGTLYVSAYVRRHLTVLAGVLLVMLAWSYRLDRYMLVIDGGGSEHAFTWLDHILGLPGSLVLALATLATALVVIWSGWTGQIRMAFAAITGVLVLALLVRQIAPYLVARSDEERDPKVRERPYVATRAGYTRRAFGVERVAPADSVESYASLADAARGISVWDPGAIESALERSRPVAVAGGELGWRATPGGDLVALAPERILPRGGWTLSRVLANSTDDHGGIVRVAATGTVSPDDAPLQLPLVHDSAGGYLIVSDSTGRVAGMRLGSSLARLALAWSVQRPALLFGDMAQPHPLVVSHRDVRERLRALAPFFTQGTAVTPLVSGDTLVWVVDLYAASSTYPLSLHVPVAGDDRTYFQHAATALLNASTGRVQIVADSVLDPIALTWVRRFPSLFTRWSAVPAQVRASLPPAIDAVYAQAVALGRFGTRSDSDVPRRLPPPGSGADSSLVGTEIPFLLPSRATAVAMPLLADQSERVRGLVVGTGGANRTTTWYSAPEGAPRWNTVLERLRTGDAPAPGASATIMRGSVRVIPVAGDVAFMQSVYAWRTQGAPTLARVSLLYRDSVRTGTSLTQIAGSASAVGAHPLPSLTPEGQRLRADSLYRAMREALQKGDWASFGRAFDALGRVLGAPPR